MKVVVIVGLIGLDLSLVLAFCCGQGRKKSRGCGVCWSVEGADWRGVAVRLELGV